MNYIQSNRAYMIFLDNEVLLSKKQYSHWHEIQDEYYTHFKASFPAMTSKEIIYYYEADYGGEDTVWPFSRKRILDFFNSEETILRSSNK